MKIEKIETYKDGGSHVIYTNEGEFTVDNRMRSTDPGKCYYGFFEFKSKISPKDKLNLKDALKQYKDHVPYDLKRTL